MDVIRTLPVAFGATAQRSRRGSAGPALTIAGRDRGARSVEGHGLTDLGVNLGAGGDERGLELLRQARAIGEELGAPDDIMRSYMNESHVLGELGRFDAGIDLISEALEPARELGMARL